MDFHFNEEQKMFQKAIAAFAAKEIKPLVKEAERDEKCPVEIFRKMGRLGYLFPSFPVELGGGGLGKVGDCIMLTEVGQICAGIAGALMIQGGLATLPLLKYASEAQKANYLLPAVRGEKIAAFALTEPNAGSDAASVETTAIRSGDSYIINGTKQYITNSEICDFFTLTLSTDRSRGPRGISILIVDRETPGLKITHQKKLGHHSAVTAELSFEDCRAPAQSLLGEEGKGLRYVLESLAAGRISHSARGLGQAQAALNDTMKYAQERVQFGKPIGSFQAIAFKLARMATEIEAAKSLMYHTAWLYDQGRDCRKESAMTKYYSAEVAIRVAEEAMRIHGGAGYMDESPVQRYFRDSILFATTEGTQEMQQIVISRELGLK